MHRAAALTDSLGRIDFPSTAARLDRFTGEVLRSDGTPLPTAAPAPVAPSAPADSAPLRGRGARRRP
jgi:hypothetical protein